LDSGVLINEFDGECLMIWNGPAWVFPIRTGCVYLLYGLIKWHESGLGCSKQISSEKKNLRPVLTGLSVRTGVGGFIGKVGGQQSSSLKKCRQIFDRNLGVAHEGVTPENFKICRPLW
jgi:hypothetical protein